MQRLPRITRFRVDQCLQPVPCTDAPPDPTAPTAQTDVVIIGTALQASLPPANYSPGDP
ncbi:hypothetical protein GCM10027038_26940 [Arthrobacter bambusae]